MSEEATPGPIGGFVRRPVTDGSQGGTSGGSERGLAFQLEWEADRPEIANHLTISFAGRPIWTTAPRRLDPAAWDSFLQGMATAWLRIRAEQTYPLGVTPRKPSQAFDTLLKEVVNPADATRLHEGFRRGHDLAAWFEPSGVELAPFYLMREGRTALVEAGGRVQRWYLADVVGTLERLGDAVYTRLEGDGRDYSSLAMWQSRDEADDETIEALSLGIDVRRLRSLAAAGVPRLALDRRALLRGVDEVRAAARMLAARLDDSAIADIAQLIRAQPYRETPELDRLSRVARKILSEADDDSPHVQGQKLADWLRLEHGCAHPGQRVEPKALLDSWGVTVVPFSTDVRIEAVCFWGEHAGPAILLNREGRNNRGTSRRADFVTSGGARATLAHEVCHLLVDRDSVLPVAEVLGGSVPHIPEERARSFAAEYLLPQDFAGEVFRAEPTVEDAIRSLSRTYGVSSTIAAWQILKRFGHTEAVLSWTDRWKLRAIVDRHRTNRDAA